MIVKPTKSIVKSVNDWIVIHNPNGVGIKKILYYSKTLDVIRYQTHTEYLTNPF
jgi:hypothetical protein